jgi:hypothetical protein
MNSVEERVQPAIVFFTRRGLTAHAGAVGM